MFISKVLATVKKYNLIAKNNTILIGVSGGPDSLALLYVLNSLKKRLKLKLHIAHLDHMLRKGSSEDLKFVKALAKKLKLPVTTAQVNLKPLSRSGSLEEVARNARLAFLLRTAKEIKADKIALGHNLDDQAETVLMRILRGTGLYGLSAISAKRNIYGYWIIRPLMEIKRKEIEIFLKQKKVNPRIDPSNKEDIYFRNKIRNRLLPLLEKEYSANIKEGLANIAETCGYDYDYLRQCAQKIAFQEKKSADLNKLNKLHPAMRRIVLRLIIARLQGDTRRLTLQHIKEIESLLSLRPANSIVDLPKGISVKKCKKFLLFYRR